MTPEADYIVVGSGAGGGTVAARLVEAGYSVILLEAGGDAKAPGGDPAVANDYDVPAFHPPPPETAFVRGLFSARHYTDGTRQARDSKYVATWQGQPVDGVFY